MLAPTPPMGWNAWNTFGVNIDEKLIHGIADAFVDTGLKAAGYEYVVLDDGWMAPERGEDGRFVPDPKKFPSGMKALGDYIHSKGLKFGIYSCAGTHTCQKLPASYGNEELDARTFASWGVDFLKYDFCYKPPGVDGPALYRRMGQALRSTGRPIIFSLCNWGGEEVWKWGASAGGHMWRTTGDINDSWESVAKCGFSQGGLDAYAGPDRWNDPDMLVVGMYGQGNCAGETGCNDIEYRTHMSLWCLLASPLMIGCDVRNMTPEAKAILMAPEVLAVDQDPLGRQARSLTPETHNVQIWTKPLEDGSIAVGLFNRATKGARLVSVAWETVGLGVGDEAVVRDLWAREDLGVFKGSFSATIEPHACRLVKLTSRTSAD
ncbi:MAG: glycoside hydrolase family 27 protein [Planctomycetota bacterium]